MLKMFGVSIRVLNVVIMFGWFSVLRVRFWCCLMIVWVSGLVN